MALIAYTEPERYLPHLFSLERRETVADIVNHVILRTPPSPALPANGTSF